MPGSFELNIDPGQFTDSEIIVMLGENGTGKTTFIKMLAGRLEPDGGGEQKQIFPYFLLCTTNFARREIFLNQKPAIGVGYLKFYVLIFFSLI